MDEYDWILIAEREIARPIACEILNTCASTRSDRLIAVADELGHDANSAAAVLAEMAWGEAALHRGWVQGSKNMKLYYEICAEAESLLRCGWFPGEPVFLYYGEGVMVTTHD